MRHYREMTRSHNEHLTNEVMKINAPSVFAEKPFHEVSDKYGFIPTIQVIDALRNEGWLPVDATQKNVRRMDKQDFTKHLVRFRRLENDIIVGDSVVELVMTNSHDRSSGFVLHAGVFRTACANGIVTSDSTFQKLSVRHSRYSAEKVVQGSHDIIKSVPLITNEIESMQAIELLEKEQRLLAATALDYITPEHKEGQPVLVTTTKNLIDQMLTPKRPSDHGTDLWSTYNVIQEKCLRGGLRSMKQGKKGYKRNTTREVKSIDKNIKLNKALWEMAIKMKEFKEEA